MTRYALRKDANEPAVVEALRAAGAVVTVIGLPVDLLVAYVDSGGHKRFAFFEVKNEDKVPSARKKTDVQNAFFERHPGWPVCLVDSPQTALRHLKVLAA